MIKREIHKRCASCGGYFSREEFHKNIQNKDGLHSYCKDCRSIIRHDAYMREKEKQENVCKNKTK